MTKEEREQILREHGADKLEPLPAVTNADIAHSKHLVDMLLAAKGRKIISMRGPTRQQLQRN